MANRFQKFIYYLTAEAPIMIFLAIAWLIRKPSSWKVPVVLLVGATLLIIFFNCFFNYAKRNLPTIDVIAGKPANADGWLIGYIISYLLPIASIAIGDIIWLIVAIIAVTVLLAFTFTDYITPHPLLYIRGYKTYHIDVEGAASGYTLISKKKLRKAEDIKKVVRVFEFLLIRIG